MKKILYLLLLIGITVQSQGLHIGVVAQKKGAPAPITNYVFDGGSTSYFEDEDVTATMLDGVADPQTWVVRMKIDVTTDVSQGIIGTSDGFGNSIKWEIDAGDLTKFDFGLRDGGSSVGMTNSVWGADTGWFVFFWTYDTTDGQKAFKNGTLVDSNAEVTFTSRTAGRHFTAGVTAIPAVAQYFRGEMSDIQLYNKVLNATEMSDLTTDMSNTTTGLILNFAGNKTSTVWTSEVDGADVITNQGGVTTN